jgi:hypothetical protein
LIQDKGAGHLKSRPSRVMLPPDFIEERDLLGTDPRVVKLLQQAAAEGQSTSQLLAHLKPLASFSGMSAIRYFGEAFVWTLPESLRLTGWASFGKGGHWTDEMIDNHYATLLQEWRTSPRKREEEE